MINLRTYFKFLSRNKLYTFVNVAGFAISLMFVFLLGIYVMQELSVDKFHEKKDRIYLLVNSTDIASVANPVGDYVQSKLPEVESYTRVLSRNVNFRYGATNTFYQAMFADSTFFNIFSFDLIEGNPDNVLKSKQNIVFQQVICLLTQTANR